MVLIGPLKVGVLVLGFGGFCGMILRDGFGGFLWHGFERWVI